MILDNTCNCDADEVIKRVKKYIDGVKVSDLQNGHHEIEGEDFYVNVFEYDTKEEKDCIWEAHRQYYDVHYILSGEEVIKVGTVDKRKVQFYDEEKDYVALNATVQYQLMCRPGDLLFLDENDAHLTGCMVNRKSMHVRKAVFKIRIK